MIRGGGCGESSSFNCANSSATSRSGSVGAQQIPAFASARQTHFVPVEIKGEMAFGLHGGSDQRSHGAPGAVARAAQLLDPLTAGQRLPLDFEQPLPEGLEFASAIHAIIIRFFETFAGPDFLVIPEMKPVCRFLGRCYLGFQEQEHLQSFFKMTHWQGAASLRQ